MRVTPETITHDALRGELKQHLLDSCAAFAVERGLRIPTPAHLRQMDVPFDDVVRQVLMFGLDSWPAHIEAEFTDAPRSLPPS